MAGLMRGLKRRLWLSLTAALTFFAIPFIFAAAGIVLVLGLVAFVGLAGAVVSLLGWIALGETNALAAAATMSLIGAAAFVGMVLLFDQVACAWKKLTAPKRSAPPLRISLA